MSKIKCSKILFVSHDASRTGAPILLLHFLKAFKNRNPKFEVDIIIGADGPLRKEFEEIGRVEVLYLNKTTQQDSLLKRAFMKLRARLLKTQNGNTVLVKKIKSFPISEYDLVFSNTITNGAILHALQPIECNIVTFVHELENAIRTFTNPHSLNFNLKYSHYFLAPSIAVRTNLEINHRIANSKIFMLPYYIPSYNQKLNHNEILRREIGAESSFVVGAVGTSDWRKGIDLFIQVALQVKKKTPNTNVKFLWVGASTKGQQYERLIYDINLSGLQEDIVIIGSVPNPLDYIAIMDLFLLTSREDPYPLVVLEAAMLKKPIICFNKSGGASEFLGIDNFVTVPFLDINAMAETVVLLQNDRNKAQSIGERNWQLYNELHSEIIAVSKFERYIYEFSK